MSGLVGIPEDRFSRVAVHKGLISPPSEPPGEIMSFGVSPVNYSDSDSDMIIQKQLKSF